MRFICEDGADDREDALRSEREIAATVLPDDLVTAGLRLLRRRFQDDDAIALSEGKHLSHVFIRDGCHAAKPLGEYPGVNAASPNEP